MKPIKSATEFVEEFKEYDPLLHPVDDGDEEFEPIPALHEGVPKEKRRYDYQSTGWSNRDPLVKGDSGVFKDAKF